MVRTSVVVPTYNKREMVTEGLTSILEQSHRDFEIVIVDDGSTDGTPHSIFSSFGAQPEAMDALARMSPSGLRPFSHLFQVDDIPIQYHYNSNRGLSAARNRGIRRARGAHIAFLEPEDLWESNHLETHHRFTESHRWVRVSHLASRPVKSCRRRRKAHGPEHRSGHVFATVLAGCPICISSTIIHRTCFTECGGFDENLPACEDYDLWLRLSARYPVVFLEGAEVIQRSTRPDNAHRTWTWDRFRVYALEKSFQSGHLDPAQRLLVAEEIVRKCERLVEGFQRQQSDERANFYERKRRRFSQEVRKLHASSVAAAVALPV